MLTFTLPDAEALNALAAELSVAGVSLVPAAVAAMVLTALGAALVISALRRKDSGDSHND